MNATCIESRTWGVHHSGVHFGKALVGLRKRQGMTQDDLAQKAGVSRSLVQAAEIARVPKMRMKNYLRLARALGFDSADDLDFAWGQAGEIHPRDKKRVRTIRLAPDEYKRLSDGLAPFAAGNLERWLIYFGHYLLANRAFSEKLARDVLSFGAERERIREAEQLDANREVDEAEHREPGDNSMPGFGREPRPKPPSDPRILPATDLEQHQKGIAASQSEAARAKSNRKGKP